MSIDQGVWQLQHFLNQVLPKTLLVIWSSLLWAAYSLKQASAFIYWRILQSSYPTSDHAGLPQYESFSLDTRSLSQWLRLHWFPPVVSTTSIWCTISTH
jgi:hypothetical protein